MPFEALAKHPRAFIIAALAISIPGLFLGPAVMEPAYRVLQPVFGPLTLLIVEMLFALIIDFPLATLTSVAVCRSIRADDPADGALAGMFSLFVFGVLIMVCVAVSSVAGPLIASLALASVIPPATSAALEGLGGVVVAVLLVLFAAFDFTLCALGGIAGYHMSRLFRRSALQIERTIVSQGGS